MKRMTNNISVTGLHVPQHLDAHVKRHALKQTNYFVASCVKAGTISIALHPAL